MKLLLIFVVLQGAALSMARHVPYIVGGVEAPVGQWPWQGSLEVYKGHTCGCVLISQRWAITAAHCAGYSTSSYTAVFGLHDRSDWNVGNPKRYQAGYIKRHENYVEGGMFPHDIAVIQFSSNVQMGDGVGIVKMPPQDKTYDGENCWISGWGKTSGGSSLPKRLRQANVNVLTTSACRSYWRVDSRHVCVYVKGSVGACQGDSGGPLVCWMDDDHYEVVGVASFVRVGCITDWPSVYASVAYHRNWVRENAGV